MRSKRWLIALSFFGWGVAPVAQGGSLLGVLDFNQPFLQGIYLNTDFEAFHEVDVLMSYLLQWTSVSLSGGPFRASVRVPVTWAEYQRGQMSRAPRLGGNPYPQFAADLRLWEDSPHYLSVGFAADIPLSSVSGSNVIPYTFTLNVRGRRVVGPVAFELWTQGMATLFQTQQQGSSSTPQFMLMPQIGVSYVADDLAQLGVDLQGRFVNSTTYTDTSGTRQGQGYKAILGGPSAKLRLWQFALVSASFYYGFADLGPAVVPFHFYIAQFGITWLLKNDAI